MNNLDKIYVDQLEAEQIFARELWLDHVQSSVSEIGGVPFLKFTVSGNAPIYTEALQKVQAALSDDSLFKGRIDIEKKSMHIPFPQSMEATILETMINRTSRAISQGQSSIHSIGYVPFYNGEENKVIQPATHLILGRRGVGKSTLIGKAVEVLKKRKMLCIVVDLQAYSHRDDGSIVNDLFIEIAESIEVEIKKRVQPLLDEETMIQSLLSKLKSEKIKQPQAILELKRTINTITTTLNVDFFLFLDDFHLLPLTIQPSIISAVHSAVKGARGWLKIAGLTSLVKYYDPKTRTGLQTPGDAQIISLDLTLTDPQAAEAHLKSILLNYLNKVGLSKVSSVISDVPFRRLVWANAGVARDFLQMFAIALASARRHRRGRVVVSDVNHSIGELAKQKMFDLEQDVRNEADSLTKFLQTVEHFCFIDKKINAFLVRQEVSEFNKSVQILSDLRVIHLIHQAITPHKAGERFEAYMIDYSRFVGFRRKRNIQEIHPKHGLQFQVKELRSLPVFTKR